MNDSFAKSVVENFIKEYSEVEDILRNIDGSDVYILNTGVIISLPSGNVRIPFHEVQLIAEVKLCLHDWEFDYWVSQQ